MARKLRIEYPGAIYHITARGNKRGDIFLCDDDRRTFLHLLNDTCDRFGWMCAAYCLMDNHYHLLIKTLQANLSRGMHWLNGVYTQRFNKRHNQVGHLFQGRFKDSLVQDGQYLRTVSRYIVLNPIEASLVDAPEDWAWSSYRAALGFDEPISCLESGLVLGGFGETDAIAQRRFERFVLAGIGLDEEDLMNQPIIGDEQFIEMHQQFISSRVSNREYPIVQRLVNRPSLNALFDGNNPNGKKGKAKRNQKVYYAIEKYGYSQSDVAEYLKLHYSWVSRIVKEQKSKKQDATPLFLP